ncbi:hypothetical protein [Alkalibaculum sporogenes]|uniref:hypothetical protein n=1 Tax=Alkalibaculum sporogenes TaxID=2655001 RepID=UPI00187B3AD1|nr:hypothetical protein [Alkalibaculum sporogenes]
MKTFVKLNFFAFLYGFFLFIVAFIMINAYRLERIAPWLNDTVNSILIFIIFIVSTILFCFITTKYFNTGGLRYFLTILWIPYYLILRLLSNLLIPITYPGDKPVPVTGLFLLVIYLIYPLYIGFINLSCTQDLYPKDDDNNK